MGRLFRIILFLIVVGFLALLGFAYLGDLEAPRGEVRIPVEIEAE